MAPPTPTPGLLFVRMNPQNNLSPAEFHDWYNNEHGPTRLLLACCENGFRYRALDVSRTPYSDYKTSDTESVAKEDTSYSSPKAEWLAIYDIDDMAALDEEPYQRTRFPPWKSEREISVMSRIHVDRRLYDRVYSTEVDNYRPVDAQPEPENQASVLIVVSRTVAIDEVPAVVQWYTEKRVPELKSQPEWRRTRIWKTSYTDVDAPKDGTTELQIVHEFASTSVDQKSLAEKAQQLTSSDAEWKSSTSNVPDIRPYELFYIFGPGPRHLSVTAPKYHHPLEGTKTTSERDGNGNGRASVDSYIITPDGVKIPYLLEGSVDPNAPVIVLANSVLVDWHIWDDFVDDFFSREQNKKYRILRHLTRGRTSDRGTQPITLDVLAKDIVTLLDHLRVRKAAAVIGVSLGGATVLNFALKYPDRTNAVIPCDTNSFNPPGSAKLWTDRIAISEKENATAPNAQGQQEVIVGDELAEATVRRWAVPESYNGGELEQKVQRVKHAVSTNSLDGFKAVVQALWDYDLRPILGGASVRGTFVVGRGDGILPTTMKEMADSYGSGVKLNIIEGAGHLPMVERPKEFTTVVTDFLAAAP